MNDTSICAMKELANERVKEMPHKDAHVPDIFCAAEDVCDYRWYFIRNETDLAALKIAHFCDDCSAQDFHVEQYPAWVFVRLDDSGYDEGYGEMLSVSEFENTMRDYVSQSLQELANTPI